MRKMAELSLKIVRNKIGVIVGKNGATKKEIEKLLKCKIKIFKEGFVKIEAKDPVNLLKAKSIIFGMSRGFSLEEVECLTDDDYALEIIHLVDILGKDERALKRYRSRVIGENGRVKEKIEQMTNVKIAVSGKTIVIVGKYDDVEKAKKAIGMILQGSMIKTALSYLSRFA